MCTHNQGVVFLVHTITIEDENQCLNKCPYEYVPTLLIINKNEKLRDEKLCNTCLCI
jgi:ribosome-interacting GTPase 1